MGLQGQLSDVSSDSIPLLLIAFFATLYKHITSFLLNLFASGSHLPVETISVSASVSLVVLADQLNLNRLFSYRYADNAASDCIVCLSTFKTGEEVRKLDCKHVFHKHCLKGWLQHLNFNCPLCRSPLVSNGGESISSLSLHSATASY